MVNFKRTLCHVTFVSLLAARLLIEACRFKEMACLISASRAPEWEQGASYWSIEEDGEV